jgi:hypothetical protein
MTTSYNVLAEPVTGYELSGDWYIIVPEESRNLIINPSVETSTLGFLASAVTNARTTTYSRRGAYSLSSTPTSNATAGVLYVVDDGLTIGTVYTFSVDVLGAPGVPYKITAEDAPTTYGTTTFTGTGRWQRIKVTFITQTTYVTLFVMKNNSASTAPFYTDGWQLEEKTYATTYFDGDSIGFVPGKKHFFWEGTPHFSKSRRHSQCRAGGRAYNLKDFGVHVTTLLGLGMTTPTNISSVSAVLGSGVYQGTVVSPRMFSLGGQLAGTSYVDLQQKVASLIDILKYDRVTPAQPLILRYYPDVPNDDETLAFDLVASYRQGLEGPIDNHYVLSLALTFEEYIPYIVSEAEYGSSLTMNSSVTNINNIAERSRTGTWQAMTVGPSSSVYAFALGGDGLVYVGGDFTGLTGGGGGAYVMTWDPIARTWDTLPSSPDSTVYAIAVDAAGTVYLGGAFTTVGIGSYAGIVKYVPSTGIFSVLGTGAAGGNVRALVIGPDGTLYAGGTFTGMGGVANTAKIAKWNGSAWSALGTGATGGDVFALTINGLGQLWAGGSFTAMGGVSNTTRLALWNGSAWSALSTGANNTVEALALGPNGGVYVGGAFTTIGGLSISYVAKWNGTTFQALGTGPNAAVGSLLFDPDGNLYVGGSSSTFVTAGGVGTKGQIAIWNGSAWFPNDEAASATNIEKMFMLPDGTLYIAPFTSGTATMSGATTVTNNGQALTYPILKLTGPGNVYTLTNWTIGATIAFDDLTLVAGEVVTFNLDPARLSIESSFRGAIRYTLIAGSNLDRWYLQPGANAITLLVTSTTAASTAALMWHENYHSILTG